MDSVLGFGPRGASSTLAGGIKQMMNPRLRAKKILTLITLISICLLVIPSLSKASLVPCGLQVDDPTQPGDQTKSCQFCHLFVLFQNIVNFFLFQIVPPVAIFMIAVAGLMFIMAYFEVIPQGGQGGPSLISKAKSVITYTIFGLIIIYSAWIIVNMFFQLIGINEVGSFRDLPKNWWKINCPIE